MQSNLDQNAGPTICPTYLLDDHPASHDAFAIEGEIGPHQRVADAIAEMIESAEDGGKAIALEGCWGAGKSTVVRFLQERFSKNENHTVIIFDAWAHEGDPLRRTFIESIAKELCTLGWANGDIWNTRLEELANRRKKTTTRITPKPTKLGVAVAVSVLVVPLGSAFLAAGFREGVTLGTDLQPNWVFILGLIAILSPFWVLAANGLRVLAGKCANRFRPHITNESINESSEWAFLLSTAINETHSETVESPNPTSIEFDGYFKHLMEESLAGKERKLLLVLDNLDRVDAETAISIWGTLQTFLHARSHQPNGWFSKLWVVVPYDPSRIGKIWSQHEESEIGSGENVSAQPNTESERTKESFLDKSFQIRFHVAPPVLSDWKSFLYELVAMALPKHVSDQHMIYRVFNHCRAKGNEPPTPRELKLFVNQIGAIHRQWNHSFPLAHVAYFVLARRLHRYFIKELRDNGAFPSSSDCLLLGDELKANLAGLAFNVVPSKGLELLLADSIDDALNADGAETLKKIAERHRNGFWAVLEIVASTRWGESTIVEAAEVSSCLLNSGLMSGYNGPEVASVLVEHQRAIASCKKWMPLTPGVAQGIADAIHLQKDDTFTQSTLKKLVSDFQKTDFTKAKNNDIGNAITGLVNILNTCTALEHFAALPKQISIPCLPTEWVTVCSILESVDAEGRHWGRLRHKGEFGELSKAICSVISGGQFDDAYLFSLHLTHKSAARCDWKEVIAAINQRLDAGQSIACEESNMLQKALFLFIRLGVKEAIESQRELAGNGHLLHHHYMGTVGEDDLAKAITILSFMRHFPKLSQPSPIGNSEAGYEQMVKLLAKPNSKVVQRYYDLAKEYELLKECFEFLIINDKIVPFIVDVLKIAADSDCPEKVFTSEILIEKSQTLREYLNDTEVENRFQLLVGTVARRGELCEAIQKCSEGFDSSSAALYSEILSASDCDLQGFTRWCKVGLEGLDSEQWVDDLEDDFSCIELCIALCTLDARPSLSTNFADALENHSASILEDMYLPPDWIQELWSSSVLGSIEDDSTRKVLRDRILEKAVAKDGTITPSFFSLYRDEIRDIGSLAANDRVISHFFSPLVRENNLPGLQWLNAFFSQNPEFLTSINAEHTVGEFMARVQERLDRPIEIESQGLVESIGKSIGLVKKQKDEDDSLMAKQFESEHG